MMTFSQAIRICFAKFLTFSGRASRAEYWFFFLFIVIWSAIASFIDSTLFTSVVTSQADGVKTVVTHSSQPVQLIVGVIVFLPHLTVAWRRMHDTGRSGLFALFPLLLACGAVLVLIFGIGVASAFGHSGAHGFDVLFTRATLLLVIPTLIVLFISPLLMLWWLTRPSQPGDNKYGPNPNETAR